MKRNLIITMMTAVVLSGCVATVAPVAPPPQVEVVGVAPYPGAIWVGGAWVWHPGYHRYYWRRGYWHR